MYTDVLFGLMQPSDGTKPNVNPVIIFQVQFIFTARAAEYKCQPDFTIPFDFLLLTQFTHVLNGGLLL